MTYRLVANQEDSRCVVAWCGVDSAGNHWSVVSDGVVELDARSNAGIIADALNAMNLNEQAPRLPDGFWEAVDILHGKNINFVTTKERYTPGCEDLYSFEEYAVCNAKNSGLYVTRRPYLRIGQTKADE